MATSRYSVLFVCTANRCRSPMAEGLWRAYVAQHFPEDDWTIASAGTWALDGYPAMPLTVQAMAEQGLDVDHHRAQAADAALLDGFRLVLVMERSHKQVLQSEVPQARDRIYLLSEMVGQVYDIEDPVAGGPEDYRHTLQQLVRLLNEGAEQIRTLARVPA